MEEKRYLNLPPSPLALIESLCYIGYSIETAVADVIDNSITAKASKIWVRHSWNSGNSWLAIIDDGHGMTNDELIKAMRFGSMRPSENRSRDDMGRFGLGLKTASISQCRHLTVISKKDSQISAYEWDLDDIQSGGNNEWRLGIITSSDIKRHKILSPLYRDYIEKLESGTIVYWEKLHFEESSTIETRESLFELSIDRTRRHLELVFHRYLSPESGKRRLLISINEDPLESFNPFNPRNSATLELHEQRFSLDGEEIAVQPYILPHRNKVSQEEYDKYAGDEGYLNNQGFYVYRNRRLIIKGTWFRLLKKEELHKLIRVRVDIPNTLDHLWKIDVKKATASPPEGVRRELSHIMAKIQIPGRKVAVSHGQQLSASVKVPAWTRRAAKGNIIYEINRNYPLLRGLIDSLSSEQRDLVKNMISIVESSFPKDLFYNDFANNPEQIQEPVINKEQFEKLLDTFLAVVAPNSSPDSDTLQTLLATDPFASYSELTRTLLKKRGYHCE